jgi:ABC-2 type transport system permease protein
MTRIRALVAKELLDVRRNPGTLVPVAIVAVLAIALPFVIAIVVPVMTGQPLSDDPDLVRISAAAAARRDLPVDSRIQLFVFEQFLLLFLLTPITGAMALAAHAVIGEKQGRTLEPLLATPLTTVELLVAKVLGALLPTLAISAAALVAYFAAIAAAAEPAILLAMATPRTAILVVLVAPAAALVALQAAILVSSRVNDARTAQQFGVLLIVPIAAVMVAQFMGRMWLSASTLAAIGGGLLALWMLLVMATVVVFDRESILTRWR